MGVLRVQLSGTLRVVDGGHDVDVRAGITRAIVARLAMAAGHTVSTDELIASIWQHAPESASGTLRAHMSRLRTNGLGPYLHGGRGGYALDVDRANVDVLRFSELFLAARKQPDGDAERGELLSRALEIWQGEPFADIDPCPFVTDERERLYDEHREACEILADLHIRGHRLEDALDLARDLTERFPQHENPVRLLALALARSGRGSEALDEIDALRERLAERGVDMSDETDDLRQAILRQDSRVFASAHPEAEITRHGVPVPLTPLVGRAREIEQIENARLASRLVTLVGSAGVGKTRLAVESARRASKSIDTEQWWVDLASVTDPQLVAAAIAEVVGAPAATVAAITTRMGNRPALLILDNAEHVLTEVRMLARELLSVREGLAMLVTSREPLSIPGERVVPIRPMLQDALGDAIHLFNERATDARGGEPLPVHQRGTVRRLCTLLDGLPLALELAAARTDVLGLDSLVESLSTGHGIPGSSEAHGRGDSLEGAIRWSTDLLSPDATAVLAQLSHFAGSFDLQAVRGICRTTSGEPEELALRLARRSLVSVDETEDGDRRFRVLESIKTFARPLLDDAARSEWLARHREWFAQFADNNAPRLFTHDALRVHRAYDYATADLTLALDNAILAGDKNQAVRIAGGQVWHWFRRGLLDEGLSTVDRALAMPGEADPAVLGPTHKGAMNLAYQSGDAQTAFHHADLGVQAAQQAGDAVTLATLLGFIAYGRSIFGDHEQAKVFMNQALGMADQLPTWARSEVYMAYGQMLRATGHAAQALEASAEAKTMAAEAGYHWSYVSANYVMAKILVDVRRVRDALELIRSGVELTLKNSDPTSGLAHIHLAGGACALLERHADGATIFGAVDALGVRYDYNPVETEGADAQIHRDRVRQGLSAEDYDRFYREGASLTYADVVALVNTLR